MHFPFFWLLTLLMACGLYAHAVMAIQFLEGKNYAYDVGQDGVLMQGTRNAYNEAYRLRVNGAAYIGTIASLSPDGREARFNVFKEPVSGLEIERRVYVSKILNFARYMEVLRNPTATEKQVDVQISANLGSGTDTVLLEQRANYLLTTTTPRVQQSIPSPALLHYHSQVGNNVTAIPVLNSGILTWTYTTRLSTGNVNKIVIPANSTVRLLYFVAQEQDFNELARLAGDILQNPRWLYESMGQLALSQLLNFKPLPTTNGGEVRVSLSVGEPARRATLEDADIESRWRSLTPADTYQISLAVNQTVTIDMAADFNAYLYLFADAEGKTLLSSNDDVTSTNHNAQIVFTATQAGTYFIETTAHRRQERGTYSLTVRNGATNRPPQAYPFDYPLTRLTAPATVTFTDFSADADGQIVERCWTFGDYSQPTCSAAAATTHTFTQAGAYNVSLTVRDNSGALATHSERLFIATNAQDIVINTNNSITGELTTADNFSQTRTQAFADRYILLSPPIGEEIVIDATSTTFDTYLYLYDQYNQRIKQDNNSGGETHARLRYTPLQRGQLTVEVTSFRDNTQGNYTLNVNPAQTATPPILTIETISDPNNPLRHLFAVRTPSYFAATRFTWDFGDGSNNVDTDEGTATHTFTETGDYTINVTATNTKAELLNTRKIITVDNRLQTPSARFRITPVFGEAPLRAFFNNETTSPISDDTLTYLWSFGDGTIATNRNPAHDFRREGTYQVTLKAFSALTQQHSSYTQSIAVIDRNSPTINVTGTVRLRPQVLMAGFDPMLVDLTDTEVKMFAITRAGGAALRTVAVLLDEREFLVLQHVATYSNGDQRFEGVLTFPAGSLAARTYADLIGTQTGQFRIRAIDQAGQFHTFPAMEIAENLPFSGRPTSLSIQPNRHIDTQRAQSQVLAAGFDPALIDATDTHFMVKALIRPGNNPVQQVTLSQAQSTFTLPLRWLETLPNGDRIYGVSINYAANALPVGVFNDLFGNTTGKYYIEVKDFNGNTHRYPEVKLGNYPAE